MEEVTLSSSGAFNVQVLDDYHSPEQQKGDSDSGSLLPAGSGGKSEGGANIISLF
jgi:hypothetical protein